MSEWKYLTLSAIADIRVSNVDKKSIAGEKPVLLCNYMDVYRNDYITSSIEFMEATANASEIEKFKVQLGDVVITKDSETPYDIGIPAVIEEPIDNLVCGYHLALIKPNKNVVDSKFLGKQLAMDGSARYFSKYAAGSTRYGLSIAAIANVVIGLPSLDQQQKIAHILQTIDLAIEKTEQLIEKYQQIKAGLMHDLFTRGIGVDGKLRPPREQAPELYQETPIGWIPTDWKLVKLKDMVSFGVPVLKTGPFGSSLKGEHWVEDGVPVITIGALGDDKFSHGELLHISESYALVLNEYRMKEGEIVFSRVADVGRSVVVRLAQAGWVMSSNLMRIHLDKDIMYPEILQRQLACFSAIKKQIRCRVNSGGREVANSEILYSLLFVCPSTLEQTQILKKSNLINNKIEQEQNYLHKLSLQKTGLMHDLLTGKVPVSVDSPKAPLSPEQGAT